MKNLHFDLIDGMQILGVEEPGNYAETVTLTNIPRYITEIWFDFEYLDTVKGKERFQTDASYIALLANQISSPTASANHRATSKYQFEIPSKLRVGFKKTFRRYFSQSQGRNERVPFEFI